MWPVALMMLFAVTVLVAISRTNAADARSQAGLPGPSRVDNKRHGDNTDNSIIPDRTVQMSVATGAPPTPWIPSRDDHEAMKAIERFFARAIPNPTPDGRPFVQESLGHGGPQLELYVPIVSSHRPVAVLARNWDPVERALVANLFFAGSVGGRLAEIVRNLGFENTGTSRNGGLSIYRNRRGFFRQRAS
jgi:hypothetical protein